MSTINLQLSVEQTNQLLALLGDQPIKSGLSALTTLIKQQGDTQLAQQSVAPASDVTDVTDVATPV